MQIIFLDKKEIKVVLPELYEIMAENGCRMPREIWLSEVGSALEKENRQLLLLKKKERILGFFMYYLRGECLVAEELQIMKEYQRTGVYFALCRHLARNFKQITKVEAYAEKENLYSQRLMEKLGMQKIEEEGFFHFYGDAESLRRHFTK
mgnify:FL=1